MMSHRASLLLKQRCFLLFPVLVTLFSYRERIFLAVLNNLIYQIESNRTVFEKCILLITVLRVIE